MGFAAAMMVLCGVVVSVLLSYRPSLLLLILLHVGCVFSARRE
jgi:hypothetical protein